MHGYNQLTTPTHLPFLKAHSLSLIAIRRFDLLDCYLGNDLSLNFLHLDLFLFYVHLRSKVNILMSDLKLLEAC